MKTRTFIHSLCIAGCTVLVMSGCSDEQFATVQETKPSVAPFTLIATSGDNATSRLSFADDGLTLYWEDGDQLVMQDVDFAQSPIFLTSSLDTLSTTANFVSETGVNAGTYYVYYKGKNVQLRKENGDFTLTKDGDDICLENNNELKDELMLLSTLTVAESQTVATVSLKHLFAKLTVRIIDEEGVLPYYSHIGMLSTKAHYTSAVQIGTDEEAEVNDKLILAYSGVGNGYTASALLLPQDYTGETVYFYIGSVGGEMWAFEFPKTGMEMRAGVNYNVTLDASKATRYDFPSKELSTPEQFRALNYINIWESDEFKVTQDMDFTGVEHIPYLGDYPSLTIDGNGHTLSNLSVDLPFNEVGLISCEEASISNLTLENVSVSGGNYVGAFCGYWGSISNCQLIGTNSIVGNDHVGGIIGHCNGGVRSTFVNEGTTIKGNNYVGGIVGSCEGYSNLSICGFSGNVEATGSSVGGIVGYDDYYDTEPKITKCFSTGNIVGKSSVGGIVGNLPVGNVSLCYSTGSVVATDGEAGGIAGSGDVYDIANSYSLSDVKGSISGGISGYGRYSGHRCYFAGNVESGYGIMGKYCSEDGSTPAYTPTTCLTISPSLAPGNSDEQYVNCTDILSKVNVINGDNAFSTTEVWEGYPYNCPKLVWQLDPLNVGGDEGGIEAPPFEDEDMN